MCGRYASARRRIELLEEFSVQRDRVTEELAPDYNVAPTKPVYAVLTRRPRTQDATVPDKQDGQRDAPRGQRDEPKGERDAPRGERDAPRGERDAAAGERDAQNGERDAQNGERDAVRELRVVRWGLVPFWAKDISIGSRLINARSETISEKPAFKRAFARRRCLLPADGYYEWQKPADGPGTAKTDAAESAAAKSGTATSGTATSGTATSGTATSGTAKSGTAKSRTAKQPFYISRGDGGPLAFAGLYELWRDPRHPDGDPDAWLWTATIITTTAPDDLGRIHDRMPMVIDPASWDEWLDPANNDVGDLQALLAPAVAGGLTSYPVSRAVNSVRNNGPELVEPVELTGPELAALGLAGPELAGPGLAGPGLAAPDSATPLGPHADRSGRRRSSVSRGLSGSAPDTLF